MNSLFFFSSRRRHTRWPRDWSSDVCSSDLLLTPGPDTPAQLAHASAEYARANGELIAALQANGIDATAADGVNVWVNLATLGRSEERRVGEERREMSVWSSIRSLQGCVDEG